MTLTEVEIRNREYNLRLVIIPILLVIIFSYFYYKIFVKWKNYLKAKHLLSLL